SARLREASFPCYDFRLLQRVLASGLSLESIDEKTLSRFEGIRFNVPDDEGVFPAAHGHFDSVELPAIITQGESAEVRVSGWVLARPQPEVVRLQLGTTKTVLAHCTEPRDDVAKAFPAYATENCGFRVSTSLASLPVGRHLIALDVGTNQTFEIGRVDV